MCSFAPLFFLFFFLFHYFIFYFLSSFLSILFFSSSFRSFHSISIPSHHHINLYSFSLIFFLFLPFFIVILFHLFLSSFPFCSFSAFLSFHSISIPLPPPRSSPAYALHLTTPLLASLSNNQTNLRQKQREIELQRREANETNALNPFCSFGLDST